MSGAVMPTIADRAVRDRAARWLGRAGVRLPTFAELADPSRILEAHKIAVRAVDPDRPDPVPFRIPVIADRRSLTGCYGARLLFSDDRRAQGAGGLWLSDFLFGDRPLRPVSPQGGMAIDWELLPGRRSDFPNRQLPRRRRVAGAHERGAVRVAAPLGALARGHRPDPRLGEQRQGNLRQMRRARRRSEER